MINIAIAEDNSFLASSLIKKIELFEDYKMKFHAYNGTDLLERLKSDSNVHIIFMDIQMPEMDGIEATRQVLQKYPHIKIIMLTVLDSEQSIYNAIQAGASGYLVKESSPLELKKSIAEAIAGGATLSPTIAKKAMAIIKNPNVVQDEEEDFNLSEREKEVLLQLSKGLNYKLIATNLFISPNTVRRHTENLYIKLGVHNKAEALQKAYQYHLI